MSANEDSAGGSPTVEYIQHHLTNFCVGSCDPVTHKGVGFWALHIDTVIVSLTLGALLIFVGWRAGRNLTVSAPAGFQNFVEMVVEFVQGQVKDSFPSKNPLIAPLALTIFVWVWLMNFMDLVPVDLLPQLARFAGFEYFKFVPTTDLNTTMAIALSVVELLKVEGATLSIRHIDCLDNTPLIDIKPYFASTDSIPDAVVGWHRKQPEDD